MDDLLDQFLIESRELTQQAGDDLLALEARPQDGERLDGAFRAIHTLKGSTGLFDLGPLTGMLHAAEDLLGALRSGEARADAALIEALLACVNQTDRWVDDFEETGRLPSDAARMAAELSLSLSLSEPAAGPGLGTTPLASGAAWVDDLLADVRAEGRLTAVRYVPRADCFFLGDDPLALSRTVPGLVQLRLAARAPWPAPAAFDPFACNLVLELVSSAPAAEVRAALRLVADQIELAEVERRADPAAGSDAVGGGRTLRVEASRLDALAEIVDELVVAKNALAHLAAQAEAGLSGHALARGVLSHHAGLERLIGRLHRTVTRARMAPLAPLFRRFPRLVREISGRLSRPVDFVLSGEGVEVDKTVADGLFEPLLHVIRNALDHGIEPAQARQAAGKPERGQVSLSARQSGDHVVIEVCDDGKGLDPAEIRRTALARGLFEADALEAMDDAEALALIFLPGFSTATAVTDLSGRGVGMDAVRSAVARLGGRVALTSEAGAGSRVTLTLPLALVMTRVMVVKSAGERFGVPMEGVVETARVAADRIVPVREGRAFVLRDRAVPLLQLSDLLGLAPGAPDRAELTVLVVRAGEELAAVAVDAIEDRIDVVLRPLAGLLARMRGMAGATLMGDGEVLMVLDLPELAG